MGFVYNDTVSVIIVRWNTDRIRVALHISLFGGFCIHLFSISYTAEMEYRQRTCIFTC